MAVCVLPECTDDRLSLSVLVELDTLELPPTESFRSFPARSNVLLKREDFLLNVTISVGKANFSSVGVLGIFSGKSAASRLMSNGTLCGELRLETEREIGLLVILSLDGFLSFDDNLELVTSELESISLWT